MIVEMIYDFATYLYIIASYCGNNTVISVILKQLEIYCKMLKKTIQYFDKLEDKVRAKLSRSPILYALLGGIGVVLFWRGVWHSADLVTLIFTENQNPLTFGQLIDGPASFILGTIILLMTGIFVSAFVGNRLIISGLAGEKKLAEKAESEIETEEAQIKKIQDSISKLEKKLDHIDRDIEHK